METPNENISRLNNDSYNSASLLFVFASLFLGGIIVVICLTVSTVIAPNNPIISAVQVVTAIITTAGLGGAGFVTIRELNDATAGRYIEVVDRLFEDLNSEKSIEARRVVFQRLDAEVFPSETEDISSNEIERRKKIAEHMAGIFALDKAITTNKDNHQLVELKKAERRNLGGKVLYLLTSEERASIKYVLNSLDRVSFLSDPKIISEEYMTQWIYPMVLKSWYRIRPIIEYAREQRDEADYYALTEKVAERCEAWCIHHGKSLEFKTQKVSL